MADSYIDNRPLEEQYDILQFRLDEFYRYQKTIFLRSLRRSLNPMFIWKHFRAGLSNIRYVWSRPESAGKPKYVKNLILELAKEDEESELGYRVLTATYPIHELASVLLKELSFTDFAHLGKIHDMKSAELSAFKPKAILGFVIAVATLLLRSVPATVLGDLGISDAFYERVVFWSFAGLFVYLMLILLPGWLLIARARRRNRRANYLIQYAVLLQKQRLSRNK